MTRREKAMTDKARIVIPPPEHDGRCNYDCPCREGNLCSRDLMAPQERKPGPSCRPGRYHHESAVEELEDAVAKYAEHIQGCLHYQNGFGCDCGLADILGNIVGARAERSKR